MEFKLAISLFVMLLLNSPRAISYRPMAPSPAPISQISEPPLSFFEDITFDPFGAPAPAPDTMSYVEFEDSPGGPTGPTGSITSLSLSPLPSISDIWSEDPTPFTPEFSASEGPDGKLLLPPSGDVISIRRSFPTSSSSLSSLDSLSSSLSSSFSSSSSSLLSSATALKSEIASFMTLSAGAITKLQASSGAGDEMCLDILSGAREDLEKALEALQTNDMSLLKSMLSGVTTDLKTCDEVYKETGEEPAIDTDTIEKLRTSAGNCLDFITTIEP